MYEVHEHYFMTYVDLLSVELSSSILYPLPLSGRLTERHLVFTIERVRFGWDEAKRHANSAKHGVDFLDAPEMFEGPMLVAPDTRKEYGESRDHSRAADGRRLH